MLSPTLTPLHFKGIPHDVSKFYDLEYFYRKTSIPVVEQSALKWWNFTTPPPVEPLTCWSVLEAVAGGRNINDGECASTSGGTRPADRIFGHVGSGSMAVHNIDIKYYLHCTALRRNRNSGSKRFTNSTRTRGRSNNGSRKSAKTSCLMRTRTLKTTRPTTSRPL